MRCLFAASEICPLAKTGGLADVAATLSAALANLGVDIRLVMPAYPEALDQAQRKQSPVSLGDMLGARDIRVVPARTPDTGLPLWLVDCPALYQRKGGLYADPDGEDWADNAMRFALLCQAVARIALSDTDLGWQPDVVHVHDWHLGLVPALLAAQPAPRPGSLFTIHNLAFQGLFSADMFPQLGLPMRWFTTDAMEFYGKGSFLKAGIRFADKLTTVSPRYAREILTPEYGCGLDGLLRARGDDLAGILNGIDHEGWSPDDPLLVPFPYNARDLSGKRACKSDLQRALCLEPDPASPLIAFVSRLTEQKMADVFPDTISTVLEQGAQLIIHGRGQRPIEQALSRLAVEYPKRVAVQVGYDEATARRILAGADMLAAPARFEPCGLTQMYAMRFGTLPIVRGVGGLADTVIDRGAERAIPQPDATGFSFQEPTAVAFAETVRRACSVYRTPVAWRAMQLRAMAQDFRWRPSAQRYLDLYRDIARGEHTARPYAVGDVPPVALRPTGT
jgi:starch synthase